MRLALGGGWRLRILLIILLLISIAIERRRRTADRALRFLAENDYDDRSALHQLITRVLEAQQPPGILFANRHALDLTLNWLCNVHPFNITERITILALDEATLDALNRTWPRVRVIRWSSTALESRFAFASGEYQLFQVLRAAIAAELSFYRKDFWMLQADTYWSTDLFQQLNPFYMMGDVLFDREGSGGLAREMIAGGNFFIRANSRSQRFFKEIAMRLRTTFATDNNIMSSLCASKFAGIQCGEIPFRLMANWRWHLSSEGMPEFMQFDEFASAKLERMHSIGLRFASESGSCVQEISPSSLNEKTLRRLGLPHSSSLWALRIAHGLGEWLVQLMPCLSQLIVKRLLPHFAYWLVL